MEYFDVVHMQKGNTVLEVAKMVDNHTAFDCLSKHFKTEMVRIVIYTSDVMITQ